MKTILLDVGGTFIKCSDGREIPVDSAGSRESIVASLREAVGDAGEAAVAIPGPFDYGRGIFLMKHKFASVYGESFAELCGGRVACRFIHDVNAMLLGEISCGAGKDCGRVALVTLGTGLGFSLSIDGEILVNDSGGPRLSLWNLPYRDGILEDYVSKRGFLRGYEGITVKDLADRARSGNEAALARFREVGGILAENLTPILKEYGIECLLLGGQISRSFDLFGPSLQSEFKIKHIGPVSDIGNATFNGLRALLEGKG